MILPGRFFSPVRHCPRNRRYPSSTNTPPWQTAELTYDLFSGRHDNGLDVMEDLHHGGFDGFQHGAPVRGDRVRRFFQHALHVPYERNVNVSYQLRSKRKNTVGRPRVNAFEFCENPRSGQCGCLVLTLSYLTIELLMKSVT